MKRKCLLLILVLFVVLTLLPGIASADDVNDFTLVLGRDGKAYKNSVSSENEISLPGLYCETVDYVNIWKLENFSFITTALRAVELETRSCLILSGTNEIKTEYEGSETSSGLYSADEVKFRGNGSNGTYGIYAAENYGIGHVLVEDSAKVTLKGGKIQNGRSFGVKAYSIVVYKDAQLTALGGESSGSGSSVGIQSDFFDFSVTPGDPGQGSVIASGLSYPIGGMLTDFTKYTVTGSTEYNSADPAEPVDLNAPGGWAVDGGRAVTIKITAGTLPKQPVPDVEFSASGYDCGILSAADLGWMFSTDGGLSWTSAGSLPCEVSDINTSDGILVKNPGDGIYYGDSDFLTIVVGRAEPPEGVSSEDCQSPENNDGRLFGVMKDMEFKKSDSSIWISGNGEEIIGRTSGSYQVRRKASAKDLASESVVIEIREFVPASPSEEYTIHFDLNGGDGTVSDQTTVDQKLAVFPDAARSGYSFNGWYTQNNGGEKIAADYIFSGDITVFAQWTKKSSGGSSSGGSSYTYYTIKASADKGGSVSPAGSVSVRKGSDKTFIVIPDSGYKIDDVLIDGKSVGSVDTYTFKDVGGNHRISAAFIISSEQNEAQTGNVFDFSDVAETDWFYDNAVYAFEKGLMNGTGDKTFSPKQIATRGMIAAILYRMEGNPAVSGSNPFDDVESGSYCENAVTWTAENNIAVGSGEGKFTPNENITREQLAVIMYRYASFKGIDTSKAASLEGFADYEDISEWAVQAMKWAYAEGLIQGIGDTVLDPKGFASRAQITAVLYRFCEIIMK